MGTSFTHFCAYNNLPNKVEMKCSIDAILVADQSPVTFHTKLL